MKEMDKLVDEEFLHYHERLAPLEHSDSEECQPTIRNIGWTLGNECPYTCTHCYSMSARLKGKDLSKEIVDRIVDQLYINGIETVNLGGNEPIFTNGLNHKKSLLPYIIKSLYERGIKVGLTTSGISLIYLEKYYNTAFKLLNDIDISLDSPYEEEHNKNRGANLFTQALKALEICSKYKVDHSIIMCAMNWNFSISHLELLLEIARGYGSNIRINTLKPVESKHMDSALSYEDYYTGFEFLMEKCEPLDLGEPPLATMVEYENAKGCPCGRTSFRIHAITPDGKIPVSPCVYLHEFKVGDLVKDDLSTIIISPEFKSFRIRNKNPSLIHECNGCDLIEKCRGGCTARAYLYNLHMKKNRSIFKIDPFCPKINGANYDFRKVPKLDNNVSLVHMDYLCTWIGKPIIS